MSLPPYWLPRLQQSIEHLKQPAGGEVVRGISKGTLPAIYVLYSMNKMAYMG